MAAGCEGKLRAASNWGQVDAGARQECPALPAEAEGNLRKKTKREWKRKKKKRIERDRGER